MKKQDSELMQRVSEIDAKSRTYECEAPLLIISPPGCGKTAMQEADAYRDYGGKTDLPDDVPAWAVAAMKQPHNWPTVERWLHKGIVEILCATYDPVDVAGAMVPDEHTSSRKVPLYWLYASFVPCCLFLDELTCGTLEQQAVALRVADDSREHDGLKLHPKTRVVAACNPPDMAAGAARELSAPALNRFEITRIGPEKAVEWMAYHSDENVRLAGVYLRINPQAAMATGEQIRQAVETMMPYHSPRAITRAMLKYGVNDADGVSRIVGNAWTIGFIAWTQKQDLVSPVEILAGRTDKVPVRGDAVMVVSAGIVAALGGENAQTCTDKALEFAFKWWQKAAQNNFAASCMQDVRRTVHTVTAIRTSKFQKYLDQYGEVLAIAG